MAVGGLFVGVGMLVVEGRVGGGAGGPPRPGPHCPQPSSLQHHCTDNNHLCVRAEALRRHMGLLSESRVPMCIDVYLCADCACGRARAASSQPATADLLLEQWTVAFVKNSGWNEEGREVDERGLLAAIRSQLHFSQLSAWYSRDGAGTAGTSSSTTQTPPSTAAGVPPVCYRLTHPALPGSPSPFHRPPQRHVFPTVKIHPDYYLKVSVECLPRLESVPQVICAAHSPPTTAATPAPRQQGWSDSGGGGSGSVSQTFKSVFAELGHCLLDPPSRIPPLKQGFLAWRERRSQQSSNDGPPLTPSTSNRRPPRLSIGVVDDRMQCRCKQIGKHRCEEPEHMDSNLDLHTSPHIRSLAGSREKERRKGGEGCGSPPPPAGVLSRNHATTPNNSSCGCRERELNAANKRGGGTAPRAILPPASPRPGGDNPLKRKRQEDSSNSNKMLCGGGGAPPTHHLIQILSKLHLGSSLEGSQKRQERDEEPRDVPSSPLLASSSSSNNKSGWSDSSSEETESEGPVGCRKRTLVGGTGVVGGGGYWGRRSGPLLGSLEESLLQRRMVPQRIIPTGYTLDLGASGSFCPKHLTLPVTVELYPPIGLSTPLLGSAVVGRKGYSVPGGGTVQVTLLNPHGTVVKMFVVPYSLEDMPPNSTTFLRQRITASPPSQLRYLIHLRFCSSKSGRIYLEGELRMVVCRQYDADATLGLDPVDSELTSTVIGPTHPKYTPRTKST